MVAIEMMHQKVALDFQYTIQTASTVINTVKPDLQYDTSLLRVIGKRFYV